MTLLAPDFLDAVVALGFMSPDGTIVYSATGFFIGRAEGTREDGQTLWRLFLVTNSHVFEGQENAKVRINPGPEGPAGEYDIQLLRGENDPLWKTHHDPEIDVAVLPIAAGKLQKAGLEIGFFRIPQHIANLEKCREEGLSEGDGVFVLGFPMGLIGEERNYVIARSGGIARVRDALYSSSKDFLIDTFIFPGNSGGPVILRPEAFSIVGTKTITESYLIGIVKGYVPYQDIAYSLQTQRPRVVFEENSGLASVHPIDFILDILDVGFPVQPNEVMEDL